MESEIPSSLVVEFMALFASDRAEGRSRALLEYLALFPGAEDDVAAAYVAAIKGGEPLDEGARKGAAGQRIGPYRIERELGRGGQGVVYLARDDRLRRSVALKVVPRSPLTDDMAPRFRREAEVAAGFDHPSLCTLFDVGHDDSAAWIAFRYVEGETLAQRVGKSKEPLPIADVLRIGEQAARALHVAHEAGVVHRDVKPQNLMITPQGDVVVLDFGVAQRSAEGEMLTLSGQAVGTPAYIAPEALTTGSSKIGRSVDIWGLGVTLYEAATGTRPFDAPTREALIQSILLNDPPDPRSRNPEIPRDLAVVILTAIAKESDRRYRTAGDLAEDLRRVREHEPILARPVTVAVRISRFCRRKPALAAALLALALVLIVGFATTAMLLVKTKRTLSEKEILLADFTQLSEQKVARDLLEAEKSLWPAAPERQTDFSRWIGESREVVSHRSRYLSALSRFETAGPTTASEATRNLWMREQLTQLVADLQKLEGRIPAVESRSEFARTLRQRTIEAQADLWARVHDAVASDARFSTKDGKPLEIVPQLGLVPLGEDPESRLQEFAVLETGTPPQRDPATHRLVMTAESAVVLVLVPGGPFRVGAIAPTSDHPLGSKRVDPNVEPYEGPLVDLVLDPFFISKYEMTQAQWVRHAESNPSNYRTGSKFFHGESDALHPVDSMDWPTADRVCRELLLMLPTEAQWERAARAGTDTIWWTGDERASLRGACNLADTYAKEHDGHPNWGYDLELDDGFTVHAPIGRFRPNAFGLFDVIGNVAEWCRDTWEDWAEFEPKGPEGLSENPTNAAHCLRGGAFSSGPLDGRMTKRIAHPITMAPFNGGLRPARSLQR